MRVKPVLMGRLVEAAAAAAAAVAARRKHIPPE